MHGLTAHCVIYCSGCRWHQFKHLYGLMKQTGCHAGPSHLSLTFCHWLLWQTHMFVFHIVPAIHCKSGSFVPGPFYPLTLFALPWLDIYGASYLPSQRGLPFSLSLNSYGAHYIKIYAFDTIKKSLCALTEECWLSFLSLDGALVLHGPQPRLGASLSVFTS